MGQPDGSPGNDSATTTVTVGLVREGPSGTPNPAPGRQVVQLSLTVANVQSLGFAWTASCPGLPSAGVFSDPTAQTPTWTPPPGPTSRTIARKCLIQVTVTSAAGSETRSYVQRLGRP